VGDNITDLREVLNPEQVKGSRATVQQSLGFEDQSSTALSCSDWGETDFREKSRSTQGSSALNCSFSTCLSSFVVMADVPASAAWTLIDVEKVGMILLSYLRCCFQVLELFLGRFLGRKGEFATTGTVRATVAPQRPPLRQTLNVPFSHPGIAQRSTTPPCR
jgi:hypothetical protein